MGLCFCLWRGARGRFLLGCINVMHPQFIGGSLVIIYYIAYPNQVKNCKKVKLIQIFNINKGFGGYCLWCKGPRCGCAAEC